MTNNSKNRREVSKWSLKTGGRSIRVVVSTILTVCFEHSSAFISSPEPKAHGELIVYRRSGVRPSVRPSVNIFKHEYLCDLMVNCNQILSEASLGWGKSCNRFLA